ncbi:MAG: hypothetical protein RLZZ573_2377 [Pseudomonadota bacterium]|jgi:hypothetical protein
MTIRHLVLLKFIPGATAAQVQGIEREFSALLGRIEAVQGLEWGTNNSPEGLAKNFTHCFNLDFADAAGRDAYLPHPVHLAFVEVLKPLLEDVLVFDYAT